MIGSGSCSVSLIRLFGIGENIQMSSDLAFIYMMIPKDSSFPILLDDDDMVANDLGRGFKAIEFYQNYFCRAFVASPFLLKRRG